MDFKCTGSIMFKCYCRFVSLQNNNYVGSKLNKTKCHNSLDDLDVILLGDMKALYDNIKLF